MTTITALPDPPSRADPTNFATRADAFLAALPDFVTETNTVAGEVNTAATAAAASAVAADASATAAAASATNAADAVTLQSYTWAGKPSAATNTGKRIRISDVGISPGLVVVSDGSKWLADGVQVLATSGTGVSAGANTSVNTLATLAIPAGLLGDAGSLRLVCRFVASGGAGATKTAVVRWGGGSGTVVCTTALVAGTLLMEVNVRNLGAANSQAYDSTERTLGASSIGNAASVDTSAATSFVLTGQKANSTETITLEHYRLEVLP